MRVDMRHIAGVLSQLEKTRLVKKLRGARQCKRQATGKKVEGRKSLAEMRPEAVKAARRLRRANPKIGERLSFRNVSGRSFNAQSIRTTATGATSKPMMSGGLWHERCKSCRRSPLPPGNPQ